MAQDQLKESLQKLRESLNNADSVDAETLELARNLEADIEKIVSVSAPDDALDSSIDLATALEAKFETEYPLTSGIIREIINTLHKIGV